jgi:hypothetical protein
LSRNIYALPRKERRANAKKSGEVKDKVIIEAFEKWFLSLKGTIPEQLEIENGDYKLPETRRHVVAYSVGYRTCEKELMKG